MRAVTDTRRFLLLLMIGAALVLRADFQTPAFGSTDTTNLSVTASVQSGCSVSANALSFGSYNVGGSAVNGSAGVTINCASQNTPWTLNGDNGANSTPGTRNMKLLMSVNNDLLNYSLYSDAGHMAPFGTGVTGGATIGGTGNGTPTIYGQIPGTQAPPTGSYADTVGLTLTF